MASRHYDIVFSEVAAQQLRDLRDKRAKKAIARKIDSLETDPQSRAKALVEDLAGYYSMRAAKRYRVVFRIANPDDEVDEDARGTVVIACVGIRKQGDRADVYKIASKLRSQGHL